MFELKQIQNLIYILRFDEHYDLCMHFLRYQEYYESPKFKDKKFELIDLIEWYSKKYSEDGIFTYVDDWAGFNIPGKLIFEVDPPDMNRYDRFMKAIAEEIRFKTDTENFYLIGTVKNTDLETLKHEIAHGLYYTNKDYRYAMNDEVDKLMIKKSTDFKFLCEELMYNESVLKDEVHAYMATGLVPQFKDLGTPEDQEPFIKIFEEYYKDIKI